MTVQQRVRIAYLTTCRMSASVSVQARLYTSDLLQLAGAKACDLCIISGGGPRPSNLGASATAVREEWLLKGTEQYKLDSPRPYAVK